MTVRILRLFAVAVSVAFAIALGAPPTFAANVWWSATSIARPSTLPPGGKGEIVVYAQNRGYEAAEGVTAPITLEDALAPGMKAAKAEYRADAGENDLNKETFGACALNAGKTVVSCEVKGEVGPYREIEVKISVSAPEEVAGEGQVSVAGGGAAGTVTAPSRSRSEKKQSSGFRHCRCFPKKPAAGQRRRRAAIPSRSRPRSS